MEHESREVGPQQGAVDESLTCGGHGPQKIVLAAKALRGLTAVVVFGLPLAVGAAGVAGYGLYKVYRRLKGK